MLRDSMRAVVQHPAGRCNHFALRCAILGIEMNAFVPIRTAEASAMSVEEKEQRLLAQLAQVPSLIIALSGGADSAYLSWAAQRVLGKQALSVTAISPSFSAHDRATVEEFVHAFGMHHEFVETHEMENSSYRANAADRCF